MIPDNVLFFILGVLALFCLIIFGIPVYIFLYRPKDEKLERLATYFLVLFTLGMGAVQQIILLWEGTGDISHAVYTVEIMMAVCLVSTGIIYGYRKFTGMKVDLGLGTVAASIFTGVWLFTSNMTLGLITLGLGFVFLVVVFMYQKKTGEIIDLSSRKMYGFIQAISVAILGIVYLGPFLLLIFPNSIPFGLLLLAMFCVFYYSLFYRVFLPISHSELADLQEEELYLNLPFDTAFETCKNAIAMFQPPDRTEIISSDPKNGTISVFVYTLANIMTKSSTQITLSLERTTPTQTHVKISGITSDPMGPLPKVPTGMNGEYVNQMAGYIRKISHGM
jgi:hypothetical protein